MPAYYPSIIEQTSDGRQQFDLPSRLLKDRIILVSGEVEDTMATSIVAQLLFLSAISNDTITMYVNSPGGSVTAGLSIVDTMNLISAPVSTVVIGLAASMGTLIASSGEKGKRFITTNAEYLIHQPMGGTGAGTQETDMTITANHLTKTRETLTKILADNSGKTPDEIAKDIERDNWLSAQQAIDYGFVDDFVQK